MDAEDDNMVDMFGYFIYGESSENSEDEEDEADETSVHQPVAFTSNSTYDISLPAQHSYLGSDLNELSGRTVLEDHSCQRIPLLSLPGVVLIPGQTLPLQLSNPVTVGMMEGIINSDHVFGLLNTRFSGRTFGSVMDMIGTTAEIRSYRILEEEANHGITELRIKAEGRQRFKVLDTQRQIDGLTVGTVQILPEVCQRSLAESCGLPSLNKLMPPPPDDESHNAKKSQQPCNVLFHPRPQRHNRFDFAKYTVFPEFVYKMYDPHILTKRIKDYVQNWNKSLGGDLMPNDPRQLSYWLAANLPLNDSQRVDLLKLNDVAQRLRAELTLLEGNSVLSCRDCLSTIAQREDIFTMSLQGPQGTYVNSNGYVHEALTVSKARGLSLLGRPSTVQSWFPGYAWTICECVHCQVHIGWKFTAVSKNTRPTKFWALCRAAIQNRISGSEDEQHGSE